MIKNKTKNIYIPFFNILLIKVSKKEAINNYS